MIDNVLVDVVCMGRFYDFLEKKEMEDGELFVASRFMKKIGLTQLIHSVKVKLDENILSQYPEGYRHLAYLQIKLGFKVKKGLPGIRGPGVEKL